MLMCTLPERTMKMSRLLLRPSQRPILETTASLPRQCCPAETAARAIPPNREQ